MLYLYLCHALCSFLYCVHVIFVILRLIKKLGHLKKSVSPRVQSGSTFQGPEDRNLGTWELLVQQSNTGCPGPTALTGCDQDIGATVPARDWGQVSSTVWFAALQVVVLPHYLCFKANCNCCFFFFAATVVSKATSSPGSKKKKKGKKT